MLDNNMELCSFTRQCMSWTLSYIVHTRGHEKTESYARQGVDDCEGAYLPTLGFCSRWISSIHMRSWPSGPGAFMGVSQSGQA